MEMDEMELDRYITGMMDTERKNLKRNVRAENGKKHPCKTKDDKASVHNNKAVNGALKRET